MKKNRAASQQSRFDRQRGWTRTEWADRLGSPAGKGWIALSDGLWKLSQEQLIQKSPGANEFLHMMKALADMAVFDDNAAAAIKPLRPIVRQMINAESARKTRSREKEKARKLYQDRQPKTAKDLSRLLEENNITVPLKTISNWLTEFRIKKNSR